MTKKIRRWLIGVLALGAVAAGGITLAFMFQRAEKTNRFISAQVSCAVHERLDGAEVDGSTAQGGEKSDIRVENTGNIKAFLRIRLVSYYVDAEGNISGRVSSVFPTPALRNGWIAGPNHTYYYPHPVEPGGVTGILCEPIALEHGTGGRHASLSDPAGIRRSDPGGAGLCSRRSVGSDAYKQ